MGLKLSKKGSKTPGNLSLKYVQRRLVNVLSRNYIRNLVSKQRRRMLVAGYDLDMTYIIDRLLAMSFPAESMRAVYCNPMWQVKSVLEMRHHSHYKVYNLCIEESYDASRFNGHVERYPFDDNHVPQLSMIKEFCEDVHSWLSRDLKNIAVVHCMVSIASQRRYVSYWEKIVSLANISCSYVKLPRPCSRELQHIRLYDTDNIDQIFVVVSELQKVPGQRYGPPAEVAKICCRHIRKDHERSNKPRYYYSFVEREEGKKEAVEPRLVVQMDTESSVIYQKNCLGHHYEKPVQFSIRDLDKVGKRGRSICGPSFCLELFFAPSYANSLSPSSNGGGILVDFE
ncbi:hypothetical protein OROGR_006880 [Orobanche gracilis]